MAVMFKNLVQVTDKPDIMEAMPDLFPVGTEFVNSTGRTLVVKLNNVQFYSEHGYVLGNTEDIGTFFLLEDELERLIKDKVFTWKR